MRGDELCSEKNEDGCGDGQCKNVDLREKGLSGEDILCGCNWSETNRKKKIMW